VRTPRTRRIGDVNLNYAWDHPAGGIAMERRLEKARALLQNSINDQRKIIDIDHSCGPDEFGG